jgi:hypothetical protein
LIIELKKFPSSIGPSTMPRIAGATGKSFSSIRKPRMPNTSITAMANALLVMANAPTMQNIRMIGISTGRGTRRMCTDDLIASQPNGIIRRLAMKKTMNTAVTISSWFWKIIGPGFRFLR